MVVDGKIYCDTLVSNNNEEVTLNRNSRVVNIKILYNNDCKSLPETIVLSNRNLSEDTVCLISFGLYNNTTVKMLDLSYNNISINGMNRLSECFTHAIPLEYVDLSGNDSSPWSVYCAIIKHSCVKHLTLCGQKGVTHYMKKIMGSLQKNVIIQSLTLCTSRSDMSRYEDVVVKVNNTERPKGMLCVQGKLFGALLSNDEESKFNNRVVNIKMLCDGNRACLPKIIDLSNSNVNDDIVGLITFGLYNNKTVRKIDLSCNNIDISGMKWLSECVKYMPLLEYIDLSRNSSSPWGVYCAIIKHCCLVSLTVCGEEGMKYYIEKLRDSLQRSTALQLLILHKVKEIEVQSIEELFHSSITLKELNVLRQSRETIVIHRKLAHS